MKKEQTGTLTIKSIDSWLTELREKHSIRNVTLKQVISKEQQIINTKDKMK